MLCLLGSQIQNERDLNMCMKCENLKGIDHFKYLREDGKAIQQTLSFRGFTLLNSPANGKPAICEVKTLWRKWAYRNQTQEICLN